MRDRTWPYPSSVRDLAASRRDLVDVKATLAEQIAHNSSEISDLRKKGERDYVEFDIKKGKKGEMSRVADIQMALTDTDPKKIWWSVCDRKTLAASR